MLRFSLLDYCCLVESTLLLFESTLALTRTMYPTAFAVLRLSSEADLSGHLIRWRSFHRYRSICGSNPLSGVFVQRRQRLVVYLALLSRLFSVLQKYSCIVFG